MGSPLGPLLANVFMCSIEDKLDQDGKLTSYYRRYVDDTFTIMPDVALVRPEISRQQPFLRAHIFYTALSRKRTDRRI